MTSASSGLISASVSAHSMPSSGVSGFAALNSAALTRSRPGTLNPVGLGVEDVDESMGVGVGNSSRSPISSFSGCEVVAC